MEMLLKDGIVKKDNNSIEFLNTDLNNDKEFLKSFNDVIKLIDGYEIKKSNLNVNKDIYYLYYFSTDLKEIEATLKDALVGSGNEILNYDDTKISRSINKDGEESIFWDVINNIIIVFGKDNLKTLLLELEKKRWECIKIQNESFMTQYMELCASDVYKKVMKSA